MPICIAHRTIQGVGGQVFLDGLLLSLVEVGSSRMNHHRFLDHRRARSNRHLFALNGNKTDSAGAKGLKGVVITHTREGFPHSDDRLIEG